MLRLAAVAMAASDPAEGEEQEPGATRAAAVERGVIIHHGLVALRVAGLRSHTRPRAGSGGIDILPVTWHLRPASELVSLAP